MIAIAGGTGRLGRRLVPRLLSLGHPVRILTRHPGTSGPGLPDGVEVVAADVTRPESLPPALEGVDVVVSAITGFGGPGAVGARLVDGEGNAALAKAARQTGVRRLVLLSVRGASASSPVELFRAKAAAEESAGASGLDWVTIRPTAYLELWLELVGAPLVTNGRTRVFGRGRNPVNFVSVADVVDAVVRAVVDPPPSGTIVPVVGPRDLTLDELARIAGDAAGVDGRIDHVPLPVLRLLAAVLGPMRPVLADQIRTAILMDTADMRAAPSGQDVDHTMTEPDSVAAAMFGVRPGPGATASGR